MLLENFRPIPNSRHGWVWALSKKGLFIPKSLYMELGGFRVRNFPLSSIWTQGIPSKVVFCMLNVYLDKVLTLNHLQTRGWSLANRCILRLNEEQSVDHLVLHCDMAFMVWSFFLSHLHNAWSFPSIFFVILSMARGPMVWRVFWLLSSIIFWGWCVGVFGRRGISEFLRRRLGVRRRFCSIFIVFYLSGWLFGRSLRTRLEIYRGNAKSVSFMGS